MNIARQNEPKIEEVGKRLLLRAYAGGKNTASEVAKIEEELTLAILSEFERSLRKLVRWSGWTISELTDRIRRSVESGISEAEDSIMREVDQSFAILKDGELCDRNLKRSELAAKYVRQKVESRIVAISEKGADAAVSYVLRQAESDRESKIRSEESKETALSEKAKTEERLAKLNATLRDAIAKFVGNRREMVAGLEAARTERDNAKKEAAEISALYEAAAKKAAETDKIADLLRGYGKAGKSPTDELREILSELRRTNARMAGLQTENAAMKSERTTYQKTFARNFELERQLSTLGESLLSLESQVRAEIELRIGAESALEALKMSAESAESALWDATKSYYAVMLRMEGSDPEPEDYADYERLGRELVERFKLFWTKGWEGFSVATSAAASWRDEWLANPENLKKLWISKLSVQAAYEKCVREIGRMTVPESVRDVAWKLKIYADVAGISANRPRKDAILDAELA